MEGAEETGKGATAIPFNVPANTWWQRHQATGHAEVQFISHGSGAVAIVSQAVEKLVKGPQDHQLQDEAHRRAVEIMVTLTDMQQLADQLTQPNQRVTTDTLTAAVAPLRFEVMTAITTSADQLTGIETTMQNITTSAPSATNLHKINDQISKLWEGNIGR